MILLYGDNVFTRTNDLIQPTLKGRQVSIPQGRCLGGSSAINAHVFVPPSKTVYDAWEKLGNPGWNWDTLKPYYVKAHSVNAPPAEHGEELGLNWMRGTDVQMLRTQVPSRPPMQTT